MAASKFHNWLAQTLGGPVDEVEYLLSQQIAIEFLMSWSIYESECFDGFVKMEKISDFAYRVVALESFDVAALDAHFDHFHARYQKTALLRHLFFGKPSDRFKGLLGVPINSVNAIDRVFFCAVVAFRYRNNIFHGNKGVRSWLTYQEQIERCSLMIQSLVNHSREAAKSNYQFDEVN